MKWSWKNLTLAATVAGTLGAAASPVVVQAMNLRAQVFLSQHKIPKKLSEAGLIRFMKSHKARKLRETTSQPIKERQFKAQMVTKFNGPPGDLEFHVLFYDVHDGHRKFIEDMGTFIDDRKQKVFLQKVKLPRSRFKPNRKMELVVVVKRAEVGRLKFQTQGEEIKRSGKVDFSDNET